MELNSIYFNVNFNISYEIFNDIYHTFKIFHTIKTIEKTSQTTIYQIINTSF